MTARRLLVWTLALLIASGGAARAAQVDKFSPTEGTVGTRITIRGSGFAVGKPKVALVGSKRGAAKVVQASDDQLVVDVTRAKAGAYSLVVALGKGTNVTAGQFTVRVPENLTFDPPCPDPGTIVTMRARFLGKKKGLVKVGGKKARVTSWSVDQMGDGSATLRLNKKTPRGQTNVSIRTNVGTANVSQALGVGLGSQCPIAPPTTSTTIGPTTTTTLPPGTLRVVSAIADSSTTILVTFNEPIDATSASNPAHYAVTTSLLSPDSPVGGQIRLPIDSAEVLSGNTTVRLTTCAQSQAKYNLKVGPVLDVLGRPITPPTLGNPDPSSAAFVGTPGAESHSDDDGLSDAIECLGWIVRTTGVDPDGPKGPEQAEVIRREVSSDRALPDTDGDGISDLTEQQRKFNPREADSDTDELTDYQEWNELFSDATRQDSDGDALDDGVEFNFLRTSPIKDDSDGDQVADGDELATANRNPRVAELPTPAIEIGEMHAELNLSFEATSTSGTRTLKGRDLTTDLTQGSERSFSSTSKESHEVFAKLGVETSVSTEISVDPEVEVGVKVNVEAGWTGNWTNEWTQDSKTNTETKYGEALKSEDEIQSGETLVRKIDGAKITTAVTLRNLSDVSFTMTNVTVAAFVQNPKSASGLTLLASLVPAVSGTDAVFQIGPGDEKGPVEFANSDVFPATVDALLRDQRGVVFKISTFTLTDENGRTFNYVEQDVTERTSRLLIDYGGRDSGVDRDGDGAGDRLEQHRVATLVGRDLGNGHFAIYDDKGKPLGITLPQALEAAGLTRYTRSQDASLTATQKRNSYSTYVDGRGIERIWRIRDVARSNLSESIWLVVDNDGVTSDLDLSEYVLKAGADGARDIRLAFLEDKDGDGLPAPVERLNGCSDTDTDTDDDGLPDRLEVAVGWEIFVRDSAGSAARRVYSRCNSTDSDGDGLSDIGEFTGIHYGDKFCTALQPCRSDPMDVDTDHDGLLDHNKRCAPGAKCHEFAYATNLADYDSDGDSTGIGDANEAALGGNPRVFDPGNFADDDGDFVPNVVEQSCSRQIAFEDVATCTLAGGCSSATKVSQPCPLSDIGKKDTDGDGLDDRNELELGLNPSSKDTDGDGIEDKAELDGVPTKDCADKAAVTLLDPLDADWDDDGRSDGGEVTGWRVQANDAATHRLVSSDPQTADCDGDDLPDGLEARADKQPREGKNCNVAAPSSGCVPYGTDPRSADTDGDDRRDSTEYGSGVTDPLVKDREVTVDFQKLVFAMCNVAETSDKPNSNYGSAEAIVELGVKLPGTQQETILLSPIAQVTGFPWFSPTLTSVNWPGAVCSPRLNASDYLQHGCLDTVKLLSGTDQSGGTGLLAIQMYHTGDEPFRPGCGSRPGSLYLDDTRKISFPMKEQANQCFTITGEFSEWDGPYPITHSDDTYTDSVWYLDEQPWFFLDFGAPGKQPTLPQLCWADLQGAVNVTHKSRLLYAPNEPQNESIGGRGRWIDVDISVR